MIGSSRGCRGGGRRELFSTSEDNCQQGEARAHSSVGGEGEDCGPTLIGCGGSLSEMPCEANLGDEPRDVEAKGRAPTKGEAAVSRGVLRASCRASRPVPSEQKRKTNSRGCVPREREIERRTSESESSRVWSEKEGEEGGWSSQPPLDELADPTAVQRLKLLRRPAQMRPNSDGASLIVPAAAERAYAAELPLARRSAPSPALLCTSPLRVPSPRNSCLGRARA